MSETENTGLAKGVGQEKTTHQIKEAYDAKHGKYENQPPTPPEGGLNDQIPAPFKVGEG